MIIITRKCKPTECKCYYKCKDPTIKFAPMPKTARAGKNGKRVMCPCCGLIHRVEQFGWNVMKCEECKSAVEKVNWYIEVS